MNRTNILQRIHSISDNSNFTLETEPTMAKIEITGKCNLSCKFCAERTLKLKHKRQRFMTMDDLKKIMAYIQKHYPSIKEIGLFLLGEPSLHPQLAEMYKYVKELGYFTFMTTNAVTIKNTLEAIDYIDSLKVSFNYLFNGNDFQEITNSEFKIQDVAKNIKALNRACVAKKKEFNISIVIDESKYDKEDHARLISTLFPGINFYYIPLQTQGGNIRDGLGGVVGEANRKSNKQPCWSLFKGLYVDCDLNIRQCCYSTAKKQIVGHINDDVRYDNLQLKQEHLNHKVPSKCRVCLITKPEREAKRAKEERLREKKKRKKRRIKAKRTAQQKKRI